IGCKGLKLREPLVQSIGSTPRHSAFIQEKRRRLGGGNFRGRLGRRRVRGWVSRDYAFPGPGQGGSNNKRRGGNSELISDRPYPDRLKICVHFESVPGAPLLQLGPDQFIVLLVRRLPAFGIDH